MTSLSLTDKDLKAALPDMTGVLEVEGSDGAIEVYRDPWGIPHVRAETVHDAFFGQGFATAQDRLWHMNHDRRWAYGRWAEYAGEAAVEQDTVMRKFQLRSSVEIDYNAVNSETKAMLDAYAAGVNAFIRNARSLPVEYRLVESAPEPWKPWDCIAVFKARHIMMGVFEGKLWRARLVNELGPERTAELLPGYPKGALLVVPPGAEYDGSGQDVLAQLVAGAGATSWRTDVEAGSNSWALAGDRTASGKPLLAGDPHRGLDTPNVYYQNHISCPDFDAVGLSFPGFPGFPHFGHNAHVAWCVTHAGSDYQDLYVERFRDGSEPLYETEDGWQPVEMRNEVIGVRDGEPKELDVAITRHGPVIAGGHSEGYGIAFKYTATDGPNTGPQCLLRMLRATSAEEMDESMRDWVDPGNNFVFADVHGNVGYLCRGRLPIRPMANAWLPVPGWDGRHEWQGFVPFDELPRSRNPDTGYIVTANNKVVGDDYPHYVGLHYATEFRARRITERVSGLSQATAQDMTEVHGEVVSIPALAYLRLLSKVSSPDGFTERARQKLLAWDGSIDKDLVAPTIYAAFRVALDRALLKHALGALAEEALTATGRGAPGHARLLSAHFAALSLRDDTSMLPPDADWESTASTALSQGVADLRERLGDEVDTWTWGKVHFTQPRHTLSDSFPGSARLLDPPSVPTSGDGDTPRQGAYSLTAGFGVQSLSVARYVFDLGDWSNSAWAVPLGASGHPGSPHYADQAPVWGEVKLLPMLYDWERIAAEAESRQEAEGRVQGSGFGVK